MYLLWIEGVGKWFWKRPNSITVKREKKIIVLCDFVGEQRRDAVKKAERNGDSGDHLPFTLTDAINDKERAYNLAKETLERSEYKSNSDFIGKFKTGNCKYVPEELHISRL